jgi:outer membrane protein assembly factor BamB
VSTVVAQPRFRTLRSFWTPLIVLAVLGSVFAVVWSLPYEEFSRFYRVVVSFAIVSLAALLFAIWWFFLSGLAWTIRLAIPLLIVALAVGSIRKVDFSGDMVPLVLFRWQTDPRAQLLAYQQSQSEAPLEEEAVKETTFKDDLTDYPEYRNRARDGVARGPDLAPSWTDKPLEERQLWRHPCGGGYAGVAVAGHFAVTIEQRDENEAIVCYDAATGRERWVHSYPAHFHDFRAEGPMATPTLVGGDVYSLGGTGRLVCLRLATGKVKWEVDILADNKILTWGMSGSPLVYDDVVVVSPGEQRKERTGNAVIAYDRKTGERVWSAGSSTGGYSSPMLATLCGQRQVVVFEGKALTGYDPAGGGELWSTPWLAQNDINVAQPLILEGDRLFVSSRYANRCAMVHLVKEKDQIMPEEEWHNAALRCPFCSPVLYKGLIYGLDEGLLRCLNPKDGRRVWDGKRYGQGQLLRSKDLILILSEKGELCLVRAAAEKSAELTRVKVLPGDKTWNCPCLANGKAYVRNHLEMACYDLRE